MKKIILLFFLFLLLFGCSKEKTNSSTVSIDTKLEKIVIDDFNEQIIFQEDADVEQEKIFVEETQSDINSTDKNVNLRKILVDDSFLAENLCNGVRHRFCFTFCFLTIIL